MSPVRPGVRATGHSLRSRAYAGAGSSLAPGSTNSRLSGSISVTADLQGTHHGSTIAQRTPRPGHLSGWLDLRAPAHVLNRRWPAQRLAMPRARSFPGHAGFLTMGGGLLAPGRATGYTPPVRSTM